MSVLISKNEEKAEQDILHLRTQRQDRADSLNKFYKKLVSMKRYELEEGSMSKDSILEQMVRMLEPEIGRSYFLREKAIVKFHYSDAKIFDLFDMEELYHIIKSKDTIFNELFQLAAAATNNTNNVLDYWNSNTETFQPLPVTEEETVELYKAAEIRVEDEEAAFLYKRVKEELYLINASSKASGKSILPRDFDTVHPWLKPYVKYKGVSKGGFTTSYEWLMDESKMKLIKYDYQPVV